MTKACEVTVSNSQNIEETEQFFRHWNIYQKIIRRNHMLHSEIADVLKAFITRRLNQPISVLDLGCGDAFLTTAILKRRVVDYYCGIDLSGNAITFAETNLNQIDGKKNFIIDDFSQCIQTIDRSFDLIIAGYSLHHLKRAEKALFFEQCHDALKRGAVFLMYDVVTRMNEGRREYLERQWEHFSQWQLTAEELAMVKAHIFEQDHPESSAQLCELACNSGFGEAEVLFSDDNDIFAAIAFSRDA